MACALVLGASKRPIEPTKKHARAPGSVQDRIGRLARLAGLRVPSSKVSTGCAFTAFCAAATAAAAAVAVAAAFWAAAVPAAVRQAPSARSLATWRRTLRK